jgi:2-keto-4-pentenoate hydratase/2-oxohepta-3-ene-1,7-dioic acid hydratase in catechol pathway
MKLMRVGPVGQERPAILTRDGAIRDAAGLVDDWTGITLDPARLAEIREGALDLLPRLQPCTRLGPPVAHPGKIIGIGLNYAEHVREAGLPQPAEPVWFLKSPTALSGPNDSIMLPRDAKQVDWEVELAVVIGRRGSYIEESAALRHIAGYTIINDVSEREFQLARGSQWTKGKSCDGFAPLGPFLATPDEVSDPQSLDIWLDLNGVRQQASSTRNMVFDIRQLIASVSRYVSLEPGDIIATGTPAGVGYAQSPQRFLKPGDTLELGITGLGIQRQVVCAYQSESLEGRDRAAD